MCRKMFSKLFVFSLFVLPHVVSPEEEEVPVDDRVRLLKFQLEDELKEQLKRNKKEHELLRIDDNESVKIANDNYDYVNLDSKPITPINERDERRVSEKFKLRQLATKPIITTLWTMKSSWPMIKREPAHTSTTTLPPIMPQFVFNPLSDDNIERVQAKNVSVLYSEQQVKLPKTRINGTRALSHALHQLTVRVLFIMKRKEKKKNMKRKGEEMSSSIKPIEIFYRQRRILYDESMRDKPLRWTHCEDMITPLLTGTKGCLNEPKVLGATHRTVLRLVHLITMNVARYSKDDIYSLMYQISNLQLRLFQWDDNAIKVLMNAICKGMKHSYKHMKRGLINLFASWHLDVSNTTNLLAQSRLFRPYCTNVQGQGGSTKSSKFARMTLSKKTTSKCEDDDENEKGSDERRRNVGSRL